MINEGNRENDLVEQKREGNHSNMKLDFVDNIIKLKPLVEILTSIDDNDDEILLLSNPLN